MTRVLLGLVLLGCAEPIAAPVARQLSPGWNGSPSIAPTVTVASFSVSCVTTTCRFTDRTISPPGIVSWSWSFGSGHYSTEQSPVHRYPWGDIGGYPWQVTLSVTDSAGRVSTSRQTVWVEPEIILSVSTEREKGQNIAVLSWSRATSSVRVVRDNVTVATVPNSGTYRDLLGKGKLSSVAYRVCDADQCSNVALASF